MTIDITYSIHPQQVSSAAFQDDKEGLQKALRFIEKKERLGFKCEPSSIVVKHRLNHKK